MKRLMLFFVLCTTLFYFSCKPINGPEGGQGDTSGDTINNAAHPTDTLFNYCANDSVLNLIFDGGNYKFMGMDYEQNHFYVIQSQEELDALCPEWVESPSIDFDTYCIVYASIITPSISDKLTNYELVYKREQDEYDFNISIQMASAGWGQLGLFLPYGLYKIRYDHQPINLHVTTNSSNELNDTTIIPDSCLHSGIIVGTIGCKDTINDCFAQGYYIITDTSDSILTFSSDVAINTNYNGKTGIYYVDDYQIPYRFIYNYINPSDTNYIHFDFPVQNMMDPGMCYPPEHFKQAIVERI